MTLQEASGQTQVADLLGKLPLNTVGNLTTLPTWSLYKNSQSETAAEAFETPLPLWGCEQNPVPILLTVGWFLYI